MGDDLDKTQKDKKFVNCNQEYELAEYKKQYGNDAVNYCCENKKNNSRDDFEKCLKNYEK
jgi:hypothetical protein